MALSDFAIDQTGLAPGVPTVSRRDILPTSLAGGPVTFTAVTAGLTYKWEVTQTPGSIVPLVGSTAQICTIAAEMTGGYLVRLTVNEGLPTEDIAELYFGIGVLINGIRYPLPALTETVQDNSIGTPEYGWLEKELAVIRAIVAEIFTGTAWYGDTVDATPTEIYEGGVPPGREAIPLNAVTPYTITVRAFDPLHGGQGKVWKIEFATINTGATTSILLDIPVITIIGQSDSPGGGVGTDLWDVDVSVHTPSDTLVLTVTGEAAVNIAWEAHS